MGFPDIQYEMQRFRYRRTGVFTFFLCFSFLLSVPVDDDVFLVLRLVGFSAFPLLL